MTSVSDKSSVDGSSLSTKRSVTTWPWMGWLAIVFAVIVLIGFVLVSGKAFQADTVGENDSGVVHPQPLGVDDDVVE